jgi:hypothetical protein
MSKLEDLKIREVEALSEFQEHISLILADMDGYREFVDKKEQKQLQKCYEYLDNLWEQIEEVISNICDADSREVNKL